MINGDIDGEPSFRATVEKIFTQCDPQNKGLVPVASLLHLVKSYLINDDTELEELYAHLDPAKINPSVGRSFFHASMIAWVDKKREEETADINAMFAAAVKRNSKLENELQNAMNELEAVREQLVTSQERNKAMEFNLRKIRKSYQMERSGHDDLKKKYGELNEAYDEACKLAKKGAKLERTMTDNRKDFEILESDYSKLENQKLALENKLANFVMKDNRKKELLVRWEQERVQKDCNIAELTRMVEDLQAQLAIQNDVVNFYTKENDVLKKQVKRLEVITEEHLSLMSKNRQLDSNHSIFNLFPFEQGIDNPDVPIANIMKTIFSAEGKPASNVKSSHAVSKILLKSQRLKRHNSSLTVQELHRASKVLLVSKEDQKTLRDELKEASSKGRKKNWEGCTSARECYSNVCENLRETVATQKDQIQELKGKLAHGVKCKMSVTRGTMTVTVKKSPVISKDTQTEDVHPTKLEVTKGNSEHEQVFAEMKESIGKIQNEHRSTVDKILAACSKLEMVASLKPLKSQELHMQKNMGNLQKTVDTLLHRLSDTKATNYGKLEYKIEKLLDRIDKLETEIKCERDCQIALRVKCQDQEKALEEFDEYKCRTDAILQANKDMLEKHALENRKLEETLREDLVVLEHEKKLLLEEILVIKAKLHEVEESKQEMSTKNDRLRRDLDIIRGEVDIEKAITTNLRNENLRLLGKEDAFTDEVQHQLCYQEVHFKHRSLDLHTSSNVTFVQMETTRELEDMQGRIKVRDVWSFLEVSCRELARASSAAMVKVRHQFLEDFDNDVVIKMLEELGQGDNSLEVLDVAMVRLNNTIKLAMLLLETMSEKLLKLCGSDRTETNVQIEEPCSSTSFSSNSRETTSNATSEEPRRKTHFPIQ